MNQNLKYTAIATQMITIVLIFVFFGQKVDENQQTERPYFTILFCVFGVFAALYLALKDFIKNSSQK